MSQIFGVSELLERFGDIRQEMLEEIRRLIQKSSQKGLRKALRELPGAGEISEHGYQATGALRSAIAVRMDGDRLGYTLGTFGGPHNEGHAIWAEFGNQYGHKLPWLRPAYRQERRYVRTQMRRMVRRILTQHRVTKAPKKP